MDIIPEAIFLQRDPQRLREMETDSEMKLWVFSLSGRNEAHKQAQKRLLTQDSVTTNKQEVLPNYSKCTKTFNYIYMFKI